MEKRKMGLLFAFSMLLVFIMCFSCVNASSKDYYKLKFEISHGTLSPNGKEFNITKGGSQEFTVTPSTGYMMNEKETKEKNKKYNNVVVDGNKITVSNIQKNMKVKVEIEKIPKLKVKNPKHAKLSPIPSSGYYYMNEGDIKEFILELDDGYMLKSAKASHSKVNIDGNKITVSDVTKDTELEIKLDEIPKYEIKSKVEKNGSISPSGTQKVYKGKSIIYTITPNSGYEIDQAIITKNSNKAKLIPPKDNKITIENVTGNVEFNVTFKKAATLTQPGNNQTSTDEIDYVTVTNPDGIEVQSELVELADDIILEDSGIDYSRKYTLTVNRPKYSINISPKGKVPIYKGETKVFTVTPKAGYAIKSAAATKKNAAKVDFEGNKVIVSNVTKSTSLSIKLAKIEDIVQDDKANDYNEPDIVVEEPQSSGQSEKIKKFLDEAKAAANLALTSGTGYGGGSKIGKGKKIDCIGYVNYVLEKIGMASLGSEIPKIVSKARGAKVGDIIEFSKDGKISKFEVVYVRPKNAALNVSDSYGKLKAGDILVTTDNGRNHIEICDGNVEIKYKTKKNENVAESVTLNKLDWNNWPELKKDAPNQVDAAKSAYAISKSYTHTYYFNSTKVQGLGAILRLR